MRAAPHVPQLDGWRGIAIVLVLIGHFGGDRSFPWLSSLGVYFFFVLSGRLMADILFVRQASLPTFFARRFSRVYPTLFIFVFIAGCAAWGTPVGYDLDTALAAVTFTLNYGVALGMLPFSILDHIWSLCIEEHSYIVLALIALIGRRMSPRLVAIVISLVGIAALANGIVRLDVYHADEISTYWRTDVSMAGIFLSAGLFLLLRQHASDLPWRWISPAALLGALLAQALGGPALVHWGITVLLLAVAVGGIELAPRALGDVFASRTLGFLGRCSFSLYLWQEPFYQLGVQAYLPQPVALVLAVAVGLVGFALIERPTRSALNQLLARRSPQAGLQA